MAKKMKAEIQGHPDFIPKIEYVDISLLEPNEGQYSKIDEETNRQVGLGSNPRWIRDTRYEALKKSITDDPEYMLYHPLEIFTLSHIKGKDGKYIIVGGNQRYQACKELGWEQIPCIVFLPDTPFEKLRAYAIKSNEAYGQNDYDILSGNEWNQDELQDWGMELDFFSGDYEDIDNEEEPKGEGDGEKEPTLTDDQLRDLIEKSSLGSISDYSDDTNYDLARIYREQVNPRTLDLLSAGAKDGSVRPQIAELCRMRIAQCTKINFDEICKFYRSGDATDTEKELLKRLYLVFITSKEAVEAGMLKIDAINGRIFEMELSAGGVEETEDEIEAENEAAKNDIK